MLDRLQRVIWATSFFIKLIKRFVIWGILKPQFMLAYAKFQYAARKQDWLQSRLLLRQLFLLINEIPARFYFELSESADRLGEVELSIGFLEAYRKTSGHSPVNWHKITNKNPLLIDLASTEKQGIAHALLAFGFVRKASITIPNVVVRANSRIVTLLRQSLHNVHVVDQSKIKSDMFQNKANLTDLRLRYGKKKVETLLLRHSLFVNESLVSKLRKRYMKFGKPIIGISWYSPHKGKQLAPIAEWSSFLSKIDATFVSLQFNPSINHLLELENRSHKKIILDAEIDQSKNLNSFAAQVKSMDLVVSIGNTTANMGGAVGTLTYVIHDDTFRWFWPVDQSDCLWYSSIRMIHKKRQPWLFVFDKLKNEIDTYFIKK